MPKKSKTAPRRKPSARRTVRKPAPKPTPKKAARKPSRQPKARAARPQPTKPTQRPEDVKSRKLAEQAGALALEKKATDVVLLDVRGLTSYADYVVIASTESERQANAIGESILSTLKAEGHRLVGSEGSEAGNWVLLDYGDVVIHLFQADSRAFYDLDGLWPDAPMERLR
ncbi:MAG: ribosome silencing factor [Myxococcaceae bacterium]